MEVARRIVAVAALIGALALAVAGYLALPGVRFADPTADAAVLSALAVVLGLLAYALLARLVQSRVEDAHGRYVLRKVAGVLTTAAVAVVLLVVWVREPAALGLSLGIVGAGIAVALTRPITSLFGLAVILANRMLRVGDRIEVADTKGDVIDIRAFYTLVMEVGEWMEAETWTGRVVTLPNYLFLEERVANYTKEFPFLWDIVTLPITYQSDWRRAQDVLVDGVDAHTRELQDGARQALVRMSRGYYLLTLDTEPRAYMRPTEHWVEVGVRFVTTPRGRKQMRSRILATVMERLEAEGGIEIASERLRLKDGRGSRQERMEQEKERAEGG